MKKVVLCVCRNKRSTIIIWCYHGGCHCCFRQSCGEKVICVFLSYSWGYLSSSKWTNLKKLWPVSCFIQSYIIHISFLSKHSCSPYFQWFSSALFCILSSFFINSDYSLFSLPQIMILQYYLGVLGSKPIPIIPFHDSIVNMKNQ